MITGEQRMDTSTMGMTVDAFACDDDYLCGVLRSNAHDIWRLRVVTSPEHRLCYPATTCLETFPLPWLEPAPARPSALHGCRCAPPSARQRSGAS